MSPKVVQTKIVMTPFIEIDFLKKSSTINLNLYQTSLFPNFFTITTFWFNFCFDFEAELRSNAGLQIGNSKKTAHNSNVCFDLTLSMKVN